MKEPSNEGTAHRAHLGPQTSAGELLGAVDAAYAEWSFGAEMPDFACHDLFGKM